MRHKLKLFSQPFSEDEEQHIEFVTRKQIVDKGPLATVRNGTTIRNVLQVCRIELYRLNEELYCTQNTEAISAIEEAIIYLDEREQDRKKRGVEGFHLP